MRSTIDGVRYDTESPRTVRVDENSSGGSRSDFRYYEEALYRTGRGRWFMAGSGHGMTKYASTGNGGMRGWGSRIIPMGADEARAWLEENSNTETIDKYFGDEIERDDRETPELATEMRALRERMSATQEAFAGQLGVSSNSVARWERGEVPVPEPVIRLARLLSTFVK